MELMSKIWAALVALVALSDLKDVISSIKDKMVDKRPIVGWRKLDMDTMEWHYHYGVEKPGFNWEPVRDLSEMDYD